VEQRWLTAQQVAEILQVKDYTVTRWIREGELRAHKLGRVWRISEEQYQEFIERKEAESEKLLRKTGR